MKIYISCDMEGISGVFSLNQLYPDAREYERARRMMTREVNCVIDAAFKYGATEILVNDSHEEMDNILIEELDSRASLISGSPKPLSMMQGIDESFDAVFFVGYHARAGYPRAVVDHTYAFRIFEAKINGRPLSEAGLNGRLAGYYNIPVALVTGDDSAINCIKEELNNPVGVIVKKAIGRTAAKIYPYHMVEKRIWAGVKKALESLQNIPPTSENGPVKLEVSFVSSGMADITLLIPGVLKKDGRTVVYTGKDYLEVYKVFRAMLVMTQNIV